MSTSSPWSRVGYRRHRGAARHRADREPAGAAVEDGRRADPVFRRRQGRPEGGVARRRSGAAASHARQEPALRAAAGRPGPRRSRPLRRPRRDRGGDRRGARRSPTCCGRASIEGGSFRHAGAPRGAGGADQRTRPTASATRWCGAIIARISASGCGRRSRRKAALAAASAATSSGRRGDSPGGFAPRGQFPPGGGRPQPRGGRNPGAGPAIALSRLPYQVASPRSGGEPDHARPAQRDLAPRGADPADR